MRLNGFPNSKCDPKVNRSGDQMRQPFRRLGNYPDFVCTVWYTRQNNIQSKSNEYLDESHRIAQRIKTVDIFSRSKVTSNSAQTHTGRQTDVIKLCPPASSQRGHRRGKGAGGCQENLHPPKIWITIESPNPGYQQIAAGLSSGAKPTGTWKNNKNTYTSAQHCSQRPPSEETGKTIYAESYVVSPHPHPPVTQSIRGLNWTGLKWLSNF